MICISVTSTDVVYPRIVDLRRERRIKKQQRTTSLLVHAFDNETGFEIHIQRGKFNKPIRGGKRQL